MAIKQQAGIGLGICGDGKGWSGGATRTDGEASQPQAIKEKRPKVFLEIEIHKRKIGQIVLELFGDVVPVTVENFRCLCTGEKGTSAVSGKPLHYKGCRFHKIMPGKFVQGGDIVKGNGTGGDSIYNQDSDACFPDESFKLKHDRPALISMAHRSNEAGKNASQFFFTSAAAPKLDGKHVVFGRIISGVDILSKLESSGTPSGRPLFESIISDCGELESEAMKTRKRKFKEEPLPPGWVEKESRNKPGLKYYVHEEGATQFERPTTRARDPLAVMAQNAKVRRLEAEREQKNALQALPTRAVEKGERRIWHILKKHKDFFGKPATSWRQKEITWSQKDAKMALLKIRDKLENIGYGGGPEALQRKFENYARLESDDNLSAKVGGDLGPITKNKVMFGGKQLAEAAFKLEQGKMADIVETKEGMHLVARFE